MLKCRLRESGMTAMVREDTIVAAPPASACYAVKVAFTDLHSARNSPPSCERTPPRFQPRRRHLSQVTSAQLIKANARLDVPQCRTRPRQ
jgi:hypothetical protein